MGHVQLKENPHGNDYNTNYDVIVCGGGTSGVAAAIASARAGANTLLVERSGTLGGQMNVSGPPGFAYARLWNPRGERDVAGIVEETYQRLYESGHALPHLRFAVRDKAGFSFSYIDPDWWTDLIYEMMDENDVTLLLDSLVVDVLTDGDTAKGVVVENANGRVEIQGKRIIDATGEGYVAIQAGCEVDYVPREAVQPHTLAFTVDGVDWKKLLRYVRSRPEQFSFKQLIFPYEGATTHEEVMDWYSKCDDITHLGELMGFYELRDIALANGDWHPYSGAGFFLIPREGGH
ncbi:MAG: FAD-dependent oxidoreductase, partial [Clostridiales Family XIII bacterium]|nr:FAD-dependent oxidoreductase [Clostridiales Family XIII bacterium]